MRTTHHRPDAHPDEPTDGPEDLLRALTAAPRPEELAGFDGAYAAYRTQFSSAELSSSSTLRRRPLRRLLVPSIPLGAKLGATLAGVALGLAGTTVAAYAGALPDSVQNAAHAVIGAPAAGSATDEATPEADHPVTPATEAPETEAPDTQAPETDPGDAQDGGSQGAAGGIPSTTPTTTAVGPDATGPAAYGLCTAWTHHQANGANPSGSVAFTNLAIAAGGVDKIKDYCATVAHPGTSAQHAAKTSGASAGSSASTGTGAHGRSGKGHRASTSGSHHTGGPNR